MYFGDKISKIFPSAELDKDVRPWELYNNIEAEVRNMMASLRAVSELQNPAIRDRHWRELMAETKVIGKANFPVSYYLN